VTDFATCTSDALALGNLPRRIPPVDITQQGAGGPVTLQTLGRETDEWFPPGLPFRPNNDVVAYVYGRCLFEDMANALETATSEEHRIYILGWSTNMDTVLKNGKMLQQYIRNTKAQVRAMFFDGIVLQAGSFLKIMPEGMSSINIYRVLQELPNGGAIMDSKHSQPATHHQKLLVVQGGLGIIAFIGGMDIQPNRAMPNPGGNDTPWHDTMVRLVGSGALDCRTVFQERWLDHPESPAIDKKLGIPKVQAFPDAPQTQKIPSVTRPLQGAPFPWTRAVRIGRTYPNLRKTGFPFDYQFAPTGEYTAWALIEHGIRTAKRWIYLEDQYVVSRMARRLLLEKLKQPGFEHLLILMNGSGAVSQDIAFSTSERNQFRADLKHIDKSESKWGMYTLTPGPTKERRQWCGDYMHSKTWIFDDEFTIVGSANCEDRGYTLNTEAVAAIGDTKRINATGEGFARQLRLMLWHKHLGVPHAKLQEWSDGLAFWNKPPGTAMVQKSTAFEPDRFLNDKYFPESWQKATVEEAWTKLCDPNAR
jgi:phosphatidylserine/phosphatidylglycerophosphate/cardiolipin synthase-like enzyme